MSTVHYDSTWPRTQAVVHDEIGDLPPEVIADPNAY